MVYYSTPKIAISTEALTADLSTLAGRVSLEFQSTPIEDIDLIFIEALSETMPFSTEVLEQQEFIVDHIILTKQILQQLLDILKTQQSEIAQLQQDILP